MNLATRALLELQETTVMAARAAAGLIRRPRYVQEMIDQMDVIGVGSLTIVLLTGFFTGGVLTLQTFPTLQFYGAQSQTGRLVAISLVRELGPVLTADRKSTRLNSSHLVISYAVFCLKKNRTDLGLLVSRIIN